MVKVVSTYRLKNGRFEDDFLVFERDGEQYISYWPGPTSEQVKKSPAFAVTRAYANVQTLASKISSSVYEQLTGERHVYPLYVLLKRVAYQLFKKGYAVDTVYTWLLEAVSDRGFWWEEWAEGKDPKAVVKEIARELVFRNVVSQPAAAEVSHECTNEQPAAVAEEIKHLGHKTALREDAAIIIRRKESKRHGGRLARRTRYNALCTTSINKCARLYIPYLDF